MAIIKPSLVFEGSDFGVRRDPAPRDYTASFFDVQFTNEKKSHIHMDWCLTNHPMRIYRWRVKRTFTLVPAHIRILNNTLWWRRRQPISDSQDSRRRCGC